MRILLVEDDAKTAALVREALAAEGLAVKVCGCGNDALREVEAAAFDVVILDIMLPDRNGLSVLAQMRKDGCRTPVLIFSARSEVNDRVEGLNLGADDYLPKPFVTAELVARVRALGRRGGESKSTILRIGDLTLDTFARRAQRAGKTIELTTREYHLLEFLMRCPGQICGRRSILEHVWDYDFTHGTNLVEVYIRRLREKIDEGFEQKLLHTVRGVGYGLKETP